MDFFNDMCILCLIHTSNIKNILFQDEDNIIVEEKLTYILSEPVKFKQDVPKNICIDCLQNLNQIYKFKQKSLKNLMYLSKYVEEMTPKELSPIENIEIKIEQEDDQLETELLFEDIIKDEIQADVKQDPLLIDDLQNIAELQNEITNRTDAPQPRTKKKPSKKSYACTHCPRIFTREGYYQAHVLNRHLRGNVFKCDICSKSFALARYLKIHKRNHQQDLPFKCDICSKQFLQYSYLKRHKATHGSEKSFQCEVCNKTFNFKTNLNCHKKIHTKERYSCGFCGKKFTQNGNLRRHERIHTGAKPFKCELCDRRFSDQSYLPIHRKSHFRDKNHSKKSRKKNE